MRSDVRKRLEAARKKPAPIRVWCSNNSGRWADWESRCDQTCADPLSHTTFTWSYAYEAALGHACLHHRSAS